jgi:large subunit ribosomal protein L24
MRRLIQRKKEANRFAARHARKAERVVMPIAKGDTVRVMRGEDKTKEGKVIRVFPKTGRITIEGINIVKRHRKARRAEEQSQIMEMPAPIHHSNVMLLDPKSGAPTRVRYRRDDEGDAKARRRSRERIAVKSDQAIPRTR